MRILNIAFALAHVGDDSNGGAEQVLWQLDRATTAAGHESVVVAAETSRISGTLFGTPQQPKTIGKNYYAFRYEEQTAKIREALASGPFDLVHMHGYDFHEFIPNVDTPILVTLHLPPIWYPQWIYNIQRIGLFMNCVSASQRLTAPLSPLIVRTITNGIRVPPLELITADQRKHAVILGRICPEKGTHVGIQAARKAGVPVFVAGSVAGFPEHLAYFEEKVQPALNGRAKFVGSIGYDEKTELLRTAKCLVVPSSAPETSSLVAMEALACGTPVIAFRSGALPEIIEHGKTGFLVDSELEMAELIGRVNEIDALYCRRTALERFSAERMTREYLEWYEHVVRAAKPPLSQFGGTVGEATNHGTAEPHNADRCSPGR